MLQAQATRSMQLMCVELGEGVSDAGSVRFKPKVRVGYAIAKAIPFRLLNNRQPIRASLLRTLEDAVNIASTL